MSELPLPEDESVIVPADDEQDDGHEILALPSDFNSEELDAYKIRDLAHYELKLRVGLAFDLISKVRQAVQHSVVHLDDKRKSARTKKDHLREQSKIDVSRNLGKHEAKRYNHNLSRINTLRQLLKLPATPDHMESNLRIINVDVDLKMVHLTAGRSRGDTALLEEPSWIWSVFEPPKERPPELMHGVRRVPDCAHWQRARMAKTQADTYVNYTCADFRHTFNGLDCLAKCWEAVGERESTSPGGRAYAYQQADMYARMRDACKTAYDKVRKPGVDGNTLDHTLVRIPS
ncbi:hypothetical protein C8Q76DRAFT_636106 [Earliella scabrosa]|nr:hypothetical protein C8Q76DRAFT_636106 [Earliella scabrosa]